MSKLDWRNRACAAVLLWATAPIGLSAQTFTRLHSFYGKNGANPYGALVQATGGNLYGTTEFGGANTICANGLGCGTVFKISPGGGPVKTLYSFCSQTGCTDGKFPQAAVVQAAGGNFYGTTLYGGVNDGGTVFKISPSGTLTSLYSFCSQSGCTDGLHPEAALVQATDGNFYGTTPEGGANPTGCKGFGCGTVFKITPSGTLTTLYRLTGPGGVYPAAGLVQDTNGNFYGTTLWGGGLCGGFCGTVFSLSVGLGPFVKTQPASARVGGFVQILGTNLTGATSVSFNGTPAVFRVVLNSWIKTTVPEGATTGTVEVVTPSGTLSSNVPFRVRP